jgi:nucleotidyltransferase substrate binding protein (TIGR01987 family)
MEIVSLRHAALRKALVTLGEGIQELEDEGFLDQPAADTSKMYKLMRDGVIQRFEYCIDSFWKFFKVYLETVQKIPIESSTPRAMLRLVVSAQLMSDEECGILLDCIAERNLTSHTYNEEMAAIIQSHIPLYYNTMSVVIDRLRIN